MSEPKRMLLLDLRPETVREWLQLPEGAMVVRAETHIGGMRGGLRLLVEGVGPTTPEGVPPYVTGHVNIVREWRDGTELARRVNWELPL